MMERDEMAEAAKHWQSEVRNADENLNKESRRAKAELSSARKELAKLEAAMELKEQELAKVKAGMDMKMDAGLREKERLLNIKEREVVDVQLKLQVSQQKIETLENHSKSMQERIEQLEDFLNISSRVITYSDANFKCISTTFEFALQEKLEIMTKLKKKEAELDNVNVNVIDMLKQELKNEKHRLHIVINFG